MVINIRKKIILSFLLFIITITLPKSIVVKAEEDDLKIRSKSAVLIEPYGKQILYEKNANLRLFPASMTKIVTLKLILDAISNKKIDWNQKVVTSKYASMMGGSQIYLAEGEEMRVEDLFKSVAIVSANDAAVALAELVAGTEEQFVMMMNQEVQKLNLKNTHFANCTGLPIENHYTSSYDIGILGIDLIEKYEDTILKYTSCYEDYIRKDTPKKFWLVNTNKLIKRYKEIDGLKTGWTNEAGYCLTCTMKKNGFRLVSVVMGSTSVDERSNDTLTLLNYGFNTYSKQTIFTENQTIKNYYNIKLNPNKQAIVVPKEVVIITKNNTQTPKYEYEIILDYRKINTYQSKKIGVVKIYDENHHLICESDLDLLYDNQKADLWGIIIELIKYIL